MTIPKSGTNIPTMGMEATSVQRSTKASQKPGEQSLADALFTATQQRLLGLLFGQPERSYFVTELIELADVGRGAVQRELARLARSELVVIERVGNQKHYRANPDSPIYMELCSIVSKTVGVEENVRVALQPLASRISLALIYGSVAKHSDTAKSDIDLLVVSDELTLEDLYSALSAAEQKLGRQVNPTLYTVSEFQKRRADNNALLSRVVAGPIAILTGQLGAA
ncbi:MAG: nucleotidyltransferase domain-containing protein [Woeseia sp.]